MKLKKRFFVGVALLLAILAVLVGCEDLGEGSAELKDVTVTVLDALDAGDTDAAYACFADVVPKSDFVTFAEQVAPFFEGDGYELKQTYIGFVTTNGVTEKKAEFLMTNEQGSFLVVTCVRSDIDGVTAFHIAPHTDQVAEFSPVSLIVGVLSIIEIAFAVVLLVDCCRRKIKNKALWILLIILGTFSVILTVGNGVNLQFNYSSWIGFTSFKSYGNGAFMLRALIPFGAIAYLCARKRLIAESCAFEQGNTTDEAVQEIAQEASTSDEAHTTVDTAQNDESDLDQN
ncbi:MAG: hypothetical protein IJY39_08595 [Clostridia bacterium]|nr:hypothetical protein [Clostridia bacterium]